jgi:hypothetical protein
MGARGADSTKLDATLRTDPIVFFYEQTNEAQWKAEDEQRHESDPPSYGYL